MKPNSFVVWIKRGLLDNMNDLRTKVVSMCPCAVVLSEDELIHFSLLSFGATFIHDKLWCEVFEYLFLHVVCVQLRLQFMCDDEAELKKKKMKKMKELIGRRSCTTLKLLRVV